MKLEIIEDNQLKENLRKRLSAGNVEKGLLDYTADYFFKLIRMLEGLSGSYELWLSGPPEKRVTTGEFFSGSLKLLELFRKTMDRMDGTAGEYISGMNISPEYEREGIGAWNYSDNAGRFDNIRGVFPRLLETGLGQDFIDEYYLDGTLLEVYEYIMEILPALSGLVKSTNPSPMDLREGVFTVETNVRKLYNRLFVDEFQGVYGLAGVMTLAEKRIREMEAGK